MAIINVRVGSNISPKSLTEFVGNEQVTIAIMADLSKAFDTVVYDTFLCKLRKLGFSKSSLH